MLINEISLRYARALDSKSESEQLYHVKKGGTFIQYITDPSPKVQLAAITNDMYSIYYINNPSLEVLNKCKHEIIKYILENIRDNDITSYNDTIFDRLKDTEWPELEIIKRSLDANHLLESTLADKIRYNIINVNGMAIRAIKNPSEELQVAAVNQNPFAIQFIKYPCEAAQMAAIKQQVQTLIAIDHPSKTVLTACKNDIIRAILRGLKYGDYIPYDRAIDKIKDLGWPELDIIKRSLDHELKNKN